MTGPALLVLAALRSFATRSGLLLRPATVYPRLSLKSPFTLTVVLDVGDFRLEISYASCGARAYARATPTQLALCPGPHSSAPAPLEIRRAIAIACPLPCQIQLQVSSFATESRIGGGGGGAHGVRVAARFPCQEASPRDSHPVASRSAHGCPHRPYCQAHLSVPPCPSP